MGADPADDKALVQTVAQEVRARIQEDLHEMVGKRQVGVVRMSAHRERHRQTARRVLVTGLSSYWGGRLAQALEAFAEVEAIIGVDTAGPDAASSSAPSSSRSPTSTR